jgi:hypothetical protein
MKKINRISITDRRLFNADGAHRENIPAKAK